MYKRKNIYFKIYVRLETTPIIMSEFDFSQLERNNLAIVRIDNIDGRNIIILDERIEKRSKTAAYTLETFLEKAIRVHGPNRYNYSQIGKDDIKSGFSYVTIGCNICGYFWPTKIHQHINNTKDKCARCRGKEHWSLERLKERSYNLYGSKYNFDKIDPGAKLRSRSIIPITCNTCGHSWPVSLGGHVGGRYGCPSCADRLRWSTDRFFIEAGQIHGDSFSYIAPTSRILGFGTKIFMICNTCSYEFLRSIKSHIKSKSGCATCKNIAPWTLERFVEESTIIHNERYDYSFIDKNQILTNKSVVDIWCKKCNRIFSQQINSHTQGKGCKHCCTNRAYSQGQIQWLQYVMQKENINIQYVLSPEGEYKIKDVGKVDGFCHETNTVYEYHGSYFHGEIGIFDHDKTNLTLGKTFGELYYNTMTRDQRIRDLGYNLIIKWEEEFKSEKKNNLDLNSFIRSIKSIQDPEPNLYNQSVQHQGSNSYNQVGQHIQPDLCNQPVRCINLNNYSGLNSYDRYAQHIDLSHYSGLNLYDGSVEYIKPSQYIQYSQTTQCPQINQYIQNSHPNPCIQINQYFQYPQTPQLNQTNPYIQINQYYQYPQSNQYILPNSSPQPNQYYQCSQSSQYVLPNPSPQPNQYILPNPSSQPNQLIQQSQYILPESRPQADVVC